MKHKIHELYHYLVSRAEYLLHIIYYYASDSLNIYQSLANKLKIL